MTPVADNACNIPTEAAEAWIAAVTKAPANTPIKGLRKVANNVANHGSSRKGVTAASILNMPVNKMEKPNSSRPVFRT